MPRRFVSPQWLAAWATAGAVAYVWWIRPEQQRKAEIDVLNTEIEARSKVKTFEYPSRYLMNSQKDKTT
jgi:hypothetical protein